MNRLAAASLINDSKLEELIYIATERAVITPIHPQLMCYAMTKTMHLDLQILTALAALQSTGMPLPQSLFGIEESLQSPTNYSGSIEMLNSMDRAILPTEKLDALYACVKQIHVEAIEARTGKRRSLKVFEPLGADDFLPLFIYCVASSHLRHPQTSMIMLWALASKEKMEGQMAYYVTVFESALYFIMNLNIGDISSKGDIGGMFDASGTASIDDDESDVSDSEDIIGGVGIGTNTNKDNEDIEIFEPKLNSSILNSSSTRHSMIPLRREETHKNKATTIECISSSKSRSLRCSQSFIHNQF